MKKLFFILVAVMGFVSTEAFAQEVRGVETRRVIYNGPRYYYSNSPGTDNYSTEYYGWELKNRNSITVSVDVELRAQNPFAGGEGKVIKKQTVILAPNESYIFKREEHRCTHVERSWDDHNNKISEYFVVYKAYKLQ